MYINNYDVGAECDRRETIIQRANFISCNRYGVVFVLLVLVRSP